MPVESNLDRQARIMARNHSQNAANAHRNAVDLVARLKTRLDIVAGQLDGGSVSDSQLLEIQRELGQLVLTAKAVETERKAAAQLSLLMDYA